jgi:hypothetical protein
VSNKSKTCAKSGNQAADATRTQIMSEAATAAAGTMSAVNDGKRSASDRTFKHMDDYIRG